MSVYVCGGGDEGSELLYQWPLYSSNTTGSVITLVCPLLAVPIFLPSVISVTVLDLIKCTL